MRKVIFALVLMLAFPMLSQAQTGTLGATVAPNGMVATSNRYATLAGIETLRQGGNAVDAMAVVQFVLAVAEPYASGLGGGAFMMVYDAESGNVIGYDGREEAPAGYTPDVFLDADGNPIPFGDRSLGGNPVGVPGTLAAVARALEEHGTLTLSEAMQPAIKLARDGYTIDDAFADTIAANADRLAQFPASAAIYLNEDGSPKAAGSVIQNPDLADTLELIADQGIGVFYGGEVGQDLVDAVQNAPVNPGVMDISDLANYIAVKREPVTTNYRGYDVYGMNMPTSGGATMMQTLNLLEAFDLKGMGWGSLDYISTFANAQNIAFSDRNAYMGDADFVDVNIPGLVDKDYARQRRNALMPNPISAAETPVQAGDPPIIEAGTANAPYYDTAFYTDTENISTTHFSIIDKDHNMVSMTTTIERLFGAGLVVPGRGFLLNNELTDFNAYPTDADGNPAANAPSGERAERRTALGDDATTVGGKRPRSSMAPTLVLRDGQPFMALGSPGGSSIIGYNLNVLVDVIDFNMDVQEAVNLPRIVGRNGSVNIGTGLYSTELASALTARGFSIREGNTGSVQAIVVGDDGKLYGAADPMRNGLALGY